MILLGALGKGCKRVLTEVSNGSRASSAAGDGGLTI
jgi:hypothetical protein